MLASRPWRQSGTDPAHDAPPVSHDPIDHFLGGRGGQAGPRIGVLQPSVVVEDPVLGAASQIGPYTRRLDRSYLIENVRRRILASALSEFYYALYRYL